MADQLDRHSLMRRNHEAIIVLALRKFGQMSRTQLSQLTGLSKVCVCSIVDQLIDEGILVETGLFSSPRGRPMVLLDINDSGAPVVGVWLSLEAVETIIATPKARFLGRRITPLKWDGISVPDTLVDDVTREIQLCAEATKVPMGSLAGVGLSIADAVDTVLGTIESPRNIPGWEGLPIARAVTERLGIPAYAENDVRAAAQASMWLSGTVRSTSALYIIYAEGIGAAYVGSNTILRGAHDMAAQIGHTTISYEGPLCICGNRGCLATLASDNAFIDSIWPSKYVDTCLPDQNRELVRRGYEMSQQGNPEAIKALANVTECMGIGLANSIIHYDPQIVFVGGTLIDFGSHHTLEMIRRETIRHLWPTAKGIEIRAIHDQREFLLKGSVGIALLQQLKNLQRDNLNTQLLANHQV